MTWTHDGRHDEPRDDQIRRALSSLPRERAAEGFTEQVLRRLDDLRDETPNTDRAVRDPFRHFRRQPALAGAALALVLVAVLLAVGVLRPGADGSGSESSRPIVAQTDGPTDGSAVGSISIPPDPPHTATQEGVKKTAASRPARPETVALLEELRREHTRLKRDLRSLRELAEGSQVIYVGGDESLDFVLELSPEGTPETGGSGVRPAGLQGSGPGARHFF